MSRLLNYGASRSHALGHLLVRVSAVSLELLQTHLFLYTRKSLQGGYYQWAQVGHNTLAQFHARLDRSHDLGASLQVLFELGASWPGGGPHVFTSTQDLRGRRVESQKPKPQSQIPATRRTKQRALDRTSPNRPIPEATKPAISGEIIYLTRKIVWVSLRACNY